MSTPQDEAIALFKSVLDSFLSGSIDIKSTLRRCFHACQILGWKEKGTWFDHELQGYPAGAELPAYRKIIGNTEWITTGGLGTIIDSIVDDKRRTKKEPSQFVSLAVWSNIDWILSAAQHGYSESTGNKSTRYISFRQQNIEIEEFKHYSNISFQSMIKSIENLVFQFASSSYSLVQYSDSLDDICNGYKNNVDRCLVSIGLGGHLDSIRTGMNL